MLGETDIRVTSNADCTEKGKIANKDKARPKVNIHFMEH